MPARIRNNNGLLNMTNPMTTKEIAALAIPLTRDKAWLPVGLLDKYFRGDIAAFIAACTPETILALTARVEVCERDAARWRLARNNRNMGLRVVLYDYQAAEDMRVLFPAPPQCDAEADAALNAKDVTL